MKKKILFLVFIMSLSIQSLAGQIVDSLPATWAADTSDKSFRLFEDEMPLEITLQLDLSTYLRNKPKEVYIKANITFYKSKTDSVSRNIKLKTRGIFRNQYCTFSPIELNLKKADFGYSDLDKITKLKLVPECKFGSENASYVLREYLVYKLFNVFTDTSFRVRLLNINYVDTEKKRKPIRRYGFFIEPMEGLAERLNCVQINSLNLNQKSIYPRLMDRIAIFNYMIGNYDWAVPGQHNIKVLKSLTDASGSYLIALPHDFDWTGLVNPDYAIPAENIGTKTVRERIFEGVCRTKETYQKDLRTFVIKKDELYKEINDFPYLSKSEKKDMTGYLDEFYFQLSERIDLPLILSQSCKRF
jgi:hypothetical protein